MVALVILLSFNQSQILGFEFGLDNWEINKIE